MKLTEVTFEDIKVGHIVTSARGVIGEIVDIELRHKGTEPWFRIEWDNGNVTNAPLEDLSKITYVGEEK